MIVGHQHLIKDFQVLVKRGKLAQGYIFFGEPQVGKFYFAKHLANFLENGEFEIDNRLLQDALILDHATGIEEMRELKQFLWQKPVISPKRTAVVNDADNLTPEAQNAILKIAEEPPANALLILIAGQLDNLLPPLVSRFQKIYFGNVKEAPLGRSGRAAILKTDLFKTAEKYAGDFLKFKEYKRSELIKSLVEDQKEQPEILDLFFDQLILKLRQDPIKNCQLLKSALHRLFLIKSYNTNKRLQLEAIL